ncbi:MULTISPECIES: PTS transporter subunit EIIC [unclassified Breznakia]|uniref:PTS sugar transporter subunit IIC n=1 Tax=unclassified Breznakia TaxID=2623764 RepID=UPI00247458E3|nr:MULTISPECIES: PTS transporter subunit EIIC [unclassified Breznakia]MDH6367678.1 PTS system cellobiose-specific IIC component [Breznakia sp. PH1-1]MDH6404729.1 PTS system cellobiose-specific IIC component [Breznakia sp. PF1-11]MDH6412444.1 PTS system cellobiose-specific IIC component [Breznakia sp. PFB1-11]MDH6414804.1 PTS system cellobiose-specific IIC component [Breznakia sp. PFB1-14]MDH6417152.1 PTS system cellobiose-specific IIC component [Breznakia sp. PFB1-4]
MNKLIYWLENSFSPKMTKINNNVWIVTLKDSIMQALPLIFLGSIFCMLAILNEYEAFAFLPSFWTPFGWTMGMISLIIAFLIPLNLMEKKRLRKQRFNAAMAGVILFLIIISPQVIADGAPGFGHSALGAGGMFVAIVAGLFAGWVMSLFGKFSFFKEDSVIPDFVRSWFDAMLPIGIIIVVGWVLVDIVGFDVYNFVLSIFMPLQNVIETPWGFSLMMFVVCFLYSLGISTWVLTPIINPVLLTAIQANIDGTALNLVTDPTIYSAYLWIGGIGCTMPLVFMLIRSKSKKLKALGTASIAPTIFNINEPIVFGAIVWNPILMIPMWLQGIILPLVVWLFTKVIAFAPIPTITFQMWYCPFPISTWLTTGSIQGILLMVIVFVIASLIWYPFFKAYEKQELDIEAKEISEKA